MKLSISKVQVQKPIFSATLEKSIAILLLPHTELSSSIQQEIQNNPLLEADFEASPAEQESTVNLQQINSALNLVSSDSPKNIFEDDNEFESSGMESMMTLEDHLFQQLFWEISDPLKREIGNFIIGNLDKDGFLVLSCEEIAEILGINDVLIVKDVLNSIQGFDPLGIATRDFKQCLIVQLKARQSPYRDLAIRIVEEFLDCLAEKRLAVISKKLFVSLEEVNQAGNLIASLEPKPARNYCSNDPNIYIEPDLFIRKNDAGQLIVETNKSGLPTLKISQTYRKLLNQPNISNEDRDFIKERITSAINYIKSLSLRGETLTAIAQYILDHQKVFFESEDFTLVPMTLKEVAEHLERCESTISRAINNKYIDTPRGLYPLKFFFSNNISQQNHGNISAYTVKQELAQLIEDENKESPLSDQEIQAHFNAKGMHLARRTIAKYRQILHIPPSHLRNQRV